VVKLFRLPSGLYNAEAEREDNYIGRQIARLRRKKGMSLAKAVTHNTLVMSNDTYSLPL